MLSAEGGVEIEEVAADQPRRHRQDPRSTRSTGSSAEAAREWVRPGRARPRGAASRRPTLLVKLYHCYVEGDCDLAEINPLILTPDGRVHALDAKVTLDDNAAFRHPEWEEYADDSDVDDPREKMAKEKGLNYIGLDGTRGHHRQRRRAGHEHARRRQPGRRRRRPTSSTSAAAPTPT